MLPERMKRVDELVSRELAIILDQKIKDPRIGMVTVSSVTVSRDLRMADVRISRLGNDPEADRECFEALEQAKGFIRRLLGQRVVLKFLPELRFHLDTSCRDAMALEKIFQKIHESDDKSD